MRKLTLAVAALGIAGLTAGTVAYAQQGPRGDGPRQHMAAISPENFQSLVDARIAALQAGLKLTDAQKSLWGPVETAVRKAAQARFDAMQAFRERRERRDEDRGDFMQRLDRRAAMADTFAASSKDLATAIRPLWATLDERQKQLLPMLIGPAGFGSNAVPLGRGGDHHRGEHRRGEHGGPGFERFGEHRGPGHMMGPGYGRMMFDTPVEDEEPANRPPAAPIRG